MDRNISEDVSYSIIVKSLSARRAWIEIDAPSSAPYAELVALRKESVDRNIQVKNTPKARKKSLSARRAWIEIASNLPSKSGLHRRSPQGERG